MTDSSKSQGADSKYCHKLENGNSSSVNVSSRTALSIIRSLKSDIKITRKTFGLHEFDPDKWRADVYSISQAKLYALNLAESAILELTPEPSSSDELLFQKLNWKLFREWLVGEVSRCNAELVAYDDAAMPSAARTWNDFATAYRRALKAFDDLGNAGEQPKDKENAAQPMGTPPVTVAPQFIELLQLIPGKCFELTADDLTRISDWCLDMLENMNAAPRWSAPMGGGAVGEADMGFDD